MDPGEKDRVRLDWHVAARPIAGHAVSGDVPLVMTFEWGALFAAVDGVGHGKEATAAAQAAVEVLKANPKERVIALIQLCHEALKNTRGVVMTVASLKAADQTMSWLGVGNVEGRLVRAPAGASQNSESVLLRGGLVGLQLPALHASVLRVAPGDLLVLATDGIDPGFEGTIHIRSSPESIAEAILARHFKGTDDALVLVARFLGVGHA